MTHYKKTSIRKKHAKRRSNTKNKSRKQRLWKMKGCANYDNMTGGCATCGCGAPANNMMTGGCGCGAQVNNMMGGGRCAGDILAYSPDYKYSCNDNLAYTGRGGSKKEGFNANLIYPLSGGGTCNSDNMPSGASYPSGAMGSPWTSNPSSWPGVAGVQGDSNYLAYNNYSYPQADRMLINTEAIPFKFGGKSKKSKKHTFRKHMRKYKTNKKYQKGGLPSLGILTDVKNTWNTLRGNPQLPSPLPFNNQLEHQQEELNM